jgi:serine/threonine protein kinase
LYALGVVLFELLAGRPMRNLEDNAGAAAVADQPVPYQYIEDHVGSDLKDIVKRMLDPNPQQRFNNANETAVALEEYIYRDGYGPTIQTVEAFMREHFSEMYTYTDSPDSADSPESSAATIADPPAGLTQIDSS